MRRLGMAMVTALLCGGAACKTAPQTREQAVTAQGGGEEGQTTTSGMVMPEQMEAIDLFFHQKVPHLQYECYNTEVDKTHKKYEGTVSISVVVQPGGKVTDVQETSTLRSLDASHSPAPGIDTCVVEYVKKWEWPPVNSPAPYQGSITFKPAW